MFINLLKKLQDNPKSTTNNILSLSLSRADNRTCARRMKTDVKAHTTHPRQIPFYGDGNVLISRSRICRASGEISPRSVVNTRVSGSRDRPYAAVLAATSVCAVYKLISWDCTCERAGRSAHGPHRDFVPRTASNPLALLSTSGGGGT